MIIMKEAEVGLEIDNFQTSEEMINVIVGLGQVWEPVQIEIGLDATSAGNTIILQGTIPLPGKKRKLNSSNKCSV